MADEIYNLNQWTTHTQTAISAGSVFGATFINKDEHNSAVIGLTLKLKETNTHTMTACAIITLTTRATYEMLQRQKHF